jgi:hypothetical protein
MHTAPCSVLTINFEPQSTKTFVIIGDVRKSPNGSAGHIRKMYAVLLNFFLNVQSVSQMTVAKQLLTLYAMSLS